MKIRVSKADVIECLVNEPIGTFDWGNWARPASGEHGGVEVCTACAVGVVVRDLIAKNNNYSDVTHLCFSICINEQFTPNHTESFEEEAEEALRGGDYMGAISLFYEGLCRQWYENDEENTTMNQIVASTVRFIEDNLPESMEIEFPNRYELPIRPSAIVGNQTTVGGES